ncbi:phosphopantetheine-binding protein [Candidatus Pristimantibacillus sp. PTI5]|uniref:phosphopantetheine-binding protein n=1 Tax=Candidatus Pristimantibacillus sp. PTI5 TaxID=3400422 RepID=UPI003B02CFA8
MVNVEQIVLESYAKVLEEANLNFKPSLDVVIGRDSGLDSLGLVNLMIEIEEALDITLESVLVEIRQSHKLNELVALVQRALEVCK